MATKISFIGTGEAFDPDRANTSYLIKSDEGSTLVDCGYDVPKSLMRFLAQEKRSVADIPNSLLITHEHGDHTAGIPALLMPIWEEINAVVGNRSDGLKRRLDIISAHQNIQEIVEKSMSSDYPGFLERFKREGPNIAYRTLDQQGETVDVFKIFFAKTSHSAVNFAYRFECPNKKSFAISGDGALTDESKKLFQGVNLLIHEGFLINGDGGANHATVEQVVACAINSGIKHLAIVHVNREQRTDDIIKILSYANKKGIYLFFPDDHIELNLEKFE